MNKPSLLFHNKQDLTLRGKRTVFAILLVAALLERTVFDLGPNFELVTTALILSSMFLGTKYSLWHILSIMIISDMVLGNTNIFLFTWSGFLIPAIFLSRVLGEHDKNIINATSLGIGTSLFFYVWTNFGVWLLDSWGMYTKNLSGLAMAYVNGLPFLRMNLLSTILLVPTGFILYKAYSLAIKVSPSNKSRAYWHQN